MSDLGWLKLHFDGLVGDDPGFEEIEWAIKEVEKVERLQERVKELEKQVQTDKDALALLSNLFSGGYA